MVLSRDRLIWLVYSLTILLGAFLMFLVQPLIGKIVTPQYGGVAQVWSLCLLFFQLALLGGYALTYGLSRLSPRVQGIVYIVLMIGSVVLVRIPMGDGWAPDPLAPVSSLLGQLMLYLAIPCVLLSTVSTKMQNWFQLCRFGEPYHLYSVSNIGSMGALLAYPVLVEPNVSVGQTLQWWTWGYWALVVLAVVTAALMLKSWQGNGARSVSQAVETGHDGGDARPITKKDLAWWIGLSASGSVLLVSYSNHLTHDIAPIPLLWIIPLYLYLLTFVLCFSHAAVYRRSWFVFLAQGLFILQAFAYLVIFAVSGNFFAAHNAVNQNLFMSLFMTIVTFFLYCMLCHGELYHRRPEPKNLPLFYLCIAFGGALGGAAVNLLAPSVFSGFYEFHLMNMGVILFSLFLMAGFKLPLFHHARMDKAYMVVVVCMVMWMYFTPLYANQKREIVVEERNFYGTVTVELHNKRQYLSLIHGTTTHGRQRIEKDSQRFLHEPTTYYVRHSAVGLADRYLRERNGGQPLNIGVIGLGAGTIAAYGEPGDRITFYEVDDKIKHIANNYFRFLKDTRAEVDILMGDGRLSLRQQEEPQQYDLLVVDAFNGDAVPVHLMTREAVELYAKHVKPDGLILMHLSNQYLDLHPVVSNVGGSLHMNPVTVGSFPGKVPSDTLSVYGVLSRSDWFVQLLGTQDFAEEYPEVRMKRAEYYPRVGVWRDDFSNVFSVLRFAKTGDSQKQAQKKAD